MLWMNDQMSLLLQTYKQHMYSQMCCIICFEKWKWDLKWEGKNELMIMMEMCSILSYLNFNCYILLNVGYVCCNCQKEAERPFEAACGHICCFPCWRTVFDVSLIKLQNYENRKILCHQNNLEMRRKFTKNKNMNTYLRVLWYILQMYTDIMSIFVMEIFESVMNIVNQKQPSKI